jgi:hypothetical protein
MSPWLSLCEQKVRGDNFYSTLELQQYVIPPTNLSQIHILRCARPQIANLQIVMIKLQIANQ